MTSNTDPRGLWNLGGKEVHRGRREDVPVDQLRGSRLWREGKGVAEVMGEIAGG